MLKNSVHGWKAFLGTKPIEWRTQQRLREETIGRPILHTLQPAGHARSEECSLEPRRIVERPQDTRRENNTGDGGTKLFAGNPRSKIERMCAVHRVARFVIRQKQVVNRTQKAADRLRQNQLRSANVMPQIGMSRELGVFLARAERNQLRAGARDHVFEVRIRNDLYPMTTSGESAAEACHRMNVSVATEGGDQELRHEL